MDVADGDRPRGSCLIDGCPRDPYPRDDGRLPLVCGPCASRLAHWLREIPVLCDELTARDAPEEVTVRSDVRPLLVGWHPPLLLQLEQLTVASTLPAAAVGVAGRGGRVSGSSEPRLPINEDRTDLLGRARSSTAATAALAYPEQDDDQIGFLPVAATLDGLAEGLRLHRGKGESRPDPSVTVLCAWLLVRLDEAADDWHGVGEMFDEVRLAHDALRGQLGEREVTDYKAGVPCRRCNLLTMIQKDGTGEVECTSCGSLLTIPEYEEYVKTMSVEAVVERKRQAVERRALVRLLREMHAVGWRHQAGIEHVDSDEGGFALVSHEWSRGDENVFAYTANGTPYDTVSYRAEHFPGAVRVSTEWAARVGTKRLHAVASAAGVLSVPKERP